MSYILKENPDKNKDVILAQIKSDKKSKNKRYLVIKPTDDDFDDQRHKHLLLEKNEKFIPLLSKKGFTRVYVAGPTGAGKSTMVANLLRNVDYPIYWFSRLEEDPVVDDKIEVTKINCEDLPDDPIDIEQLEDHIVVFDDCDVFRDKKIVKELDILNDACLETGRHYHIPSVIRTGHFLLNNKKTRQNLLECNGICFFHKSGLGYQARRFLKERAGLDKAQIDEVMNMKGRYIFVHMNAPQCFLTEHEFLSF
jgi:hypothetical protein